MTGDMSQKSEEVISASVSPMTAFRIVPCNLPLGSEIYLAYASENQCDVNDETLPPQQSLLGIPLEIRNKIYRHLLCVPSTRRIGWQSGGYSSNDDWGWTNPMHSDLSTSVLRVCRQIYDEALPFLYGENTFALKIFKGGKHSRTIEEAPFMAGYLARGCVYHIMDAKDTGIPLEKVQRYEIRIQLLYDDDYHYVRSSVRLVAETLSECPNLRQMDILLELPGYSSGYQKKIESDIRLVTVLEPFTMLRNVRIVNFQQGPHKTRKSVKYLERLVEIPPAYVRYLQSLMFAGNKPLEGLPQMYHDLQQQVGWARYIEKGMKEACEMMVKEDLEGFEAVRENLLKRVEEHVDRDSEDESENEGEDEESDYDESEQEQRL